MSYLGKISAIVSANTSDFSSKLAASGKEVASWARSLNSAVNSASSKASSSLRGIYTEAQKAERALQAIQARKIGFKGFEGQNLSAAVSRMQALISATKGVNEPLNQAARSLEKLPVAMQGGFIEAMKRAQTQAERLAFEIDKIGDGKLISGSALEQKFQAIARRAQMTAEAVGRLKEAAGAVGGLATGRELQFRNPEFSAEMARARGIQAQAAATPGGNFAGIIERQRAAADATAEAFARMEEAQLAIGGDVAGTTAEYQRQLAVLKSVGNELERAVTASAGSAAPLIARARAEQDFYETSERLQQQAASDEAALLIARARAQQDFYETSERLQQQAAADEAAPLISRARAEQDFYETSRRLRQQAAADSIAASYEGVTSSLADRRQMRARQMLGMEPRAISEVPRELDAVGGRINALRSQIESMPVALQQVMLPTLRALQNEFVQMAGAVRPTIDQLNQMDVALQHGEAAARRLAIGLELSRGLGGAGTAGIELGLDQRAVAAYTAQLQILQQAIGLVAAEGRGPAVAAMNTLRNAIAGAMADGTLETAATRAEIARLTQEAVRSAAAVSGTSERALARRMRRAGDVSRQGVDRWSLALNQAAFAVDDFMSSTGGVEQKLRAVSNNITQMAFLLGGTTGLFIGLGAVIGGQVAVGLSKWINGGRTAEDQTKALNDALARQKSLVEEVAQAFKSLGDEISRISFSEPGQQGRSFRQEAQDIRRKQKEAREASAANLDPDAIAAKSRLKQIERELAETSDPGVAARLLRDRADAVRQERAAVANANRSVGNGEEVRDLVARARIREALRDPFVSGAPRDPETRRRIEEARRQAAAETPIGMDVASRAAQRRAVQQRIEELRPNVRPRNFFLENIPFSPRANAGRDRVLFAELEQTLKRLDNELLAAVDELSIQVISKSRAAGIAIQSAQEDVAEAIRRGVRGASDFQAALDNTARQLDEAQQQLRDAKDIEDPAARELAVRRAEDRVRDVENRRDAINERAREIRLGRTFGGDRTTSALSSLQGNVRFQNESAALIARLQASIDAELAARRELEQAIKTGNDAAQAEARARLEAAQSASEAAAALAEAALEIEKAVSRLRKIADDALSMSESMANDAQKRLMEKPSSASARARDDAERQLIEDRRRVTEANNAIDFRRSQAMRTDPELLRINAELEAIAQERKNLEAEARVNGTEVDPGRARELADREARLNAEREQRLFALTEAERRQADAIAYEIDARRRLVQELERERQFDEEVRNRRTPVGDPMRGLDLAENPRQRAAREARQGMADIGAAFDERFRELADRNNGLPFAGQAEEAQRLREEQTAAFQNFAQEQMRGAAPAIFEMADAVQNAILQGPSRQALEVSDVSTMEGSKELNRLLRGDDASKNANIVELEKQNQKLTEMVTTLKDVAQKMGLVVNL